MRRAREQHDQTCEAAGTRPWSAHPDRPRRRRPRTPTGGAAPIPTDGRPSPVAAAPAHPADPHGDRPLDDGARCRCPGVRSPSSTSPRSRQRQAAAAGVRRGRAGRARPLDPRVRRAAAGGRPPPTRRLRAGHGRAAAARGRSAAGLETIPAIVRATADDAMLRDALLENIHRAALNPLEEAAAYQQLLDEFGTTHDELAQRIGRSRPQVSNTIRLLNLPLPVQRRVAAGVLSRRSRPGPARPRRPGRAGGTRAAHRGRGVVRPRDRGARRAARARGGTDRSSRRRRPRRGSTRPASPSSPTSCPTRSTPGSGSTSAGARARSPSSSPPSTTWSASSA